MEEIRLNQLGYYPESRKTAIIINSDATDFQIVDSTDKKVVFSGKLSKPISWSQSGETGRQADFSSLKTPGTYQLQVAGKELSYQFSISSSVLKEVARASMRSYYFQRCSFSLDKEYAGKWARAAGHSDTAVPFHQSSGKTEGVLNSPGGWYDAGDFGKYIVNSGITVGTLLSFYENFPKYFADKSLNIPESGDGKPDILSEVKVNLDWMKTMQDGDGGVFFKLTTLTFPGYILPEQDTMQRYIIGKSTSSTLNFAAVMAMAARVYTPFDSLFAKQCLQSALSAWAWAEKNPSVAFNNPSDVRTGEYRDNNFEDEFIWAAAELYITTSDTKFAKFLESRDVLFSSAPSWQNVQPLAALTLATMENSLPESKKAAIRNSIVKCADNWLGEMGKSLYRVPDVNFIWGSNSIFANLGVAMIYAYKITGENQYLLGACEVADYLFGKNATGISFVTGFGTKATSDPHHRHMIAAAVDPIPGFLAGGPNAGRQDSAYSPYSSRFPAKSYEDVHKSYASNEVAINWNAPLTFLLGAIDEFMSKGNIVKKGPYKLVVGAQGEGVANIAPLKKSYSSSDQITMTATPKQGWVFSHWTGLAAGQPNPCKVKLSSDASVQAVFVDPSELVSNGDFLNGLLPWSFGVHQSASAKGMVINGEYKISPITAGEQVWNIQLTQSGIKLEKGKTYEVRFEAGAKTNRKIFPNVGMSQDPWQSYIEGEPKVFEIGPEKKVYSFQFTMNAESDPNGRIEMNCGTSDVEMVLDNVSIREAKSK